jgi:hypothetical protein
MKVLPVSYVLFVKLPELLPQNIAAKHNARVDCT